MLERRTFLALLPGLATVWRGTGGAQGGEASPEEALAAAVDALSWISSTRVDTPHGSAWPADAADPKSVSSDLYHGVCGPTLLAAALVSEAETEEDRALARGELERGVAYLVRVLEESPPLSSGLYTGLAGIATTLERVGRQATQPEAALGAARVAWQRLTDRARESEAGLTYGPSTDIISGDAGIGLALLASNPGKDRLRVARGLAESLMARAEWEEAKGEKLASWPMRPGYPRRMPNFSHGTAGVATFLLRLSQREEFRQTDFGADLRECAWAGARSLLHLADERGFVHHHRPGGEELFYLGWCHGPPGTARLFHGLAEVGWVRAIAWRERSAYALAAAPIPENRPEGFWNNVGVCCGSSGIVEYAIELSRAGVVSGPLDELTARLIADLLRRGSRQESGLSWPQAEHRTRPDWIQSQTGYAQGAAGIGLSLLRWHAHLRGRDLELLLPDSLRSG